MVVDVAVLTEKRDAYDYLEKLRDPSHTSAYTLQEMFDMAKELNLTDIKTQWYNLEMELEDQLNASFPNPGDDEKIRELIKSDIGKDNLGINAQWVKEEIHFIYPTLIFVGKKPL